MDRAPPLLPVLALSFSAGGLYGWSALIPALRSRFDATEAQAGMVFSFAIVAFTLAVYVGRRPGLRAGHIAAGGALCLCGAGLAPTFALFVLLFSVGFGWASGSLYILTLGQAARMRRPTRITAVVVAAFGLGGAVLGPAMRMLGEAGAGLAALWLVALALAVSGFWGWAVGSGAAPARAQDAPPADPRSIAWFWLTFCLGSMAGLMVLGLAASIAADAGAGVWAVSLILMTVALCNTGGRLSIGWVDAIIPRRNLPIAALLVAASGLTVMLAGQGSVTIGMGLSLVAAGYGMIAAAIPALVRDHFGEHGFVRAFAPVFSAWGVAGLTAPWAAGWLFDQTGKYDAALLAALTATLAAALAGVRLRARTGPGR